MAAETLIWWMLPVSVGFGLSVALAGAVVVQRVVAGRALAMMAQSDEDEAPPAPGDRPGV